MNIIKYLQAQGLGSKKQCGYLVLQERVKINQQLVYSEQQQIDLDKVVQLTIDDALIDTVSLPYFYILLNKPIHYETSHKPRAYPSIFSLLPNNIRNLDLQAIGRLDADTSGVLIITNDGRFNHCVTSPKYKIGKVYQITLKHAVDEELVKKLIAGVLLNDEKEVIKADKIATINDYELQMSITSGKYHQVKRMIAAAGNRVVALHRIQMGELTLGELAAGQWQFIQPQTVLSTYG